MKRENFKRNSFSSSPTFSLLRQYLFRVQGSFQILWTKNGGIIACPIKLTSFPGRGRSWIHIFFRCPVERSVHKLFHFLGRSSFRALAAVPSVSLFYFFRTDENRVESALHIPEVCMRTVGCGSAMSSMESRVYTK